MNLLDQLERRQLIVMTGKGGVGKTTLAGGLAVCLAERGRNVLVLEIDPRESLYQLFDIAPSGGAIVDVAERLHLQNLRPRDVLDALVREQVGIEAIVRRVLESPVYEHFTEGAPGLRELAVLGHALRLVRGLGGRGTPPIDVVVLDAPATGHGLSMLEAPALVSSVIEEGPFGEMARELSAFIDDPDCCGVVIAAAAEEMPIQEAIELLQSIEERLGRPAEAVLVNGLYPEGAGAGLWRRRREMNERELTRLAHSWSGPLVELPLLPLGHGPSLVDALARRIEGAPLAEVWP